MRAHHVELDTRRIVGRLVAAGADVDARSKDGGTPLHWAVAEPSGVSALLRAGADPTATDRSGRTPVQLAVAAGAHRSVDEFRSWRHRRGTAD